MDKDRVLERIHQLGLLAVIRGPSKTTTLHIVEALVAGGVTGIEITFTTPQAAEVAAIVHQRYGDEIVLGMGTVTEVSQVEAARQAGAQFLVSPHTEAELGRAMVASGLAVMMGALTPSEVMQAHRLGSQVVKLFPGSLGGPEYLQALRGPFPHVRLMPTGGVNENNLKQWFAAGAFAVGAGNNLTPKDIIQQGRFAEISAIARSFREAVQTARESLLNV